MRRAGFRLVPMSSDAFMLADVLRGFSFAGRGYCKGIQHLTFLLRCK